MSTKIYNGYKLVNVDGLGDLHKFANHMRKKMALVRDHLIRRNHTWDEISKDYWNIREQYKKSAQSHSRMDSELDIKAEVQLFPMSQSRVFPDILAMTFWCNKEYTEVWERQKRVKDYGYWDNTDHPQGMTRRQWKQRGAEWDRAVPSAIPSRHGFALELVSADLPTLSALRIIYRVNK
jgi:hypothetical protein